ncbi:MAG TPA: hypothetical protein DDY31_13925 [Lachnospiraceae bacterium]|nr:hypothetical protein [Lachnospiraceae bacterium]HBI62288.1 hypothetical protein [Lachnospiraceae bacterium]
MKKLLLTEGLLACFFLALLLGFLGKYLVREREGQETNANVSIEETREKGTLWMDAGSVSESFSPLQYQSQGEKNVLAMCFMNLISRDARGKRINKEVAQKWKEKDTEAVHISVIYDEKKKFSTVTIQINPKLKTASGTALNADDLLFNFYLRCDMAGVENEPFGGVHIVGQEEYLYGSKNLEKRKKEIQDSLKKPSKELQKQLQENIVKKELSGELEWVRSLFQDDAYEEVIAEYGEPKDLFAYYYAYQTKYSAKGKTEQQVFDDVVSQYGWHYDWLAKVTNKDYMKQAQELARSVLLKQNGKDTVKQIAGIQKKDAQTVVIQAEGEEDCVDKLCDFWLLPMEEYGNRELFDGEQSFGFQKGDTAQILEQSSKQYCGTGAFYTKKINAEQILLERNKNYAGGKAKLKKIVVLRKNYEEEKDIVEDLLCQNVDIVITTDTVELNQLIQSRATHASYLIRKKVIETEQAENCLLYRTSYVNAPSIPQKLTEYQSIFEVIHTLKVNTL